MSLGQLSYALKLDLNSTRNRAAFYSHAANYPDLAGAEAPLALCDAIALTARVDLARRDAVLAALISAHHDTGAAVFGQVVLAALLPELEPLRRRMKSRESDDELDQIVVACLLEQIGRYDAIARPTNIGIRLRSRTARAVMRALRIINPPEEILDQRAENLLRLAVDMRSSERSPAQWRALLRDCLADVLTPADIEMVCATQLDDRGIRELLEPGVAANDQRGRGDARAYQALKKRHQRALGRFRAAIAEQRVPELWAWGLLLITPRKAACVGAA